MALLGLAFKPNTDDMRDAKALVVLDRLTEAGAAVVAYDPIAMEKARQIRPALVCAESAYAAAEGADAIVIATEWNEFRFLDLERLRNSMRGAIVFDGRNIYDPVRMKRLGFAYYGIGRASVQGDETLSPVH